MKISQDINPIYETIFLLYFGYDPVKYKNMVIGQINDTGKNGEEIYQKHFKTLDSYISSFQKLMTITEKDRFYFQDTSMDFYISFVTPLFTDVKLIDEIEHFDNEEIFRVILKNSEEIFERDLSEYAKLTHAEFTKTDHLMTFVNEFNLSENEKWKLLLIMQKPQEYYLNFATLIQNHLIVFEKSKNTIKSSLDKLLVKFNKTIAHEDKIVQYLSDFNITNCDINVMSPSMITAYGIILFADTCYFGIMAEEALTEFGFESNSKEYLQTCLKAFSDNSKLEILKTLKVSPKYATELAIQLGLTPATVSHHMSVLLSAKLVYVEKSGGKYYYHLNENSVKEVLDQLRELLLI